jgi:HEAT repeat protein
VDEKLAPILNQLKSDDEQARLQGIIELIKTQDPMIVPILNKIAGGDPSVEVRYYARRALDSLKGAVSPEAPEAPATSESAPPPGSPATPAPEASLPEMFASPDPRVRFEGLKLALQQGTPEAKNLISRSILQEPVPQLLASFVIALGRLGSDDDLPVLSGFLQHEDSRVRANAVEALATIGSEAAYRHLIPCLQDTDNRVKTNVIKALQAFGGPALFELLKKMAFDGEVWMRDSALFALTRSRTPYALTLLGQIARTDPLERLRDKARGHIGALAQEGNEVAAAILRQLSAPPAGTEAAPTGAGASPDTPPPPPKADSITDWLSSPDPAFRQWALIHFQQRPAPEHGPLLLQALKQETDTFLTGMIIALLKVLHLPDTFPALLPFLKSTDDRVRANAAEAVAVIASANAAEHLRPLLQDPNNRVRANTILALAQTKSIDPLEHVGRMLKDSRELFRRSALYIVATLKRPEFVPLLGSLLDDAESRIRVLAFDILRDYDKAGVSGAKQVRSKVENRIKMEKERDRFFDNSFDEVFSGVLDKIRSDTPTPQRSLFSVSPEKEKATLVQLGKKAESRNCLPDEIIKRLRQVDDEIERLNKIAETAAAQTPAAPTENTMESEIRQVSETEILKFQVQKLIERRNIVLGEGGALLRQRAASLSPQTRTALNPELELAAKTQINAPPPQDFSILPQGDPQVTEIFDLTLRLYQKHVVAFSLFSLGLGFLFFVGIIVSAIIVGLARGLLGPVAFLLALPLFFINGIGFVIGYALWKIIITLMIKHFVKGESPAFGDLFNQGRPLVFPMVLVQIKKSVFLFGTIFVATFLASPFFALAGTLSQIHLNALLKMAGFLTVFFYFGRRYFPYLLVEPAFILDQGNDSSKPFEEALTTFGRDPWKLVILYIFATFMMSLISGTTVNLISVFAMFMPLGTVLVAIVAVLSEIALSSVIYSTIVFFLLILRQKQAQSLTPSPGK